jgi:hypothetical protein
MVGEQASSGSALRTQAALMSTAVCLMRTTDVARGYLGVVVAAYHGESLAQIVATGRNAARRARVRAKRPADTR